MKQPVLLMILLIIRAYQRYVSPYKGFHCAFHAHTGRQTCSGYGYRVFARYGTVRGWRLLRRRFGACSAAAHRHYEDCAQAHAHKAHSTHRQAGFIDCGGCDVPGCDLPDVGNVCDCLGNFADVGDCCGSAKRAKDKSCTDWDLADWLTLLFILALLVGGVYLVYKYQQG